MDQPKWLQEAWRELGQRERAGRASNARIAAMYREAGHAGVISDETPWCAAFVAACLERAGVRSTRSLMARSYVRHGVALDHPRLGAVAVLSRGTDPALGHVGFVVGETRDALYLLGGNQGDSVSVAPFAKSRLVALRWPVANPADVTPVPSPPRSGESLFEHVLEHVLEMEGGYTDDPYDPGGPTNKGILLRELAAWKGVTLDALNQERMKDELRRIPDKTVRAIYLQKYWVPAQCSSLPAGLAFMHFDAAVNQGVGTAIRMLQEAVGTDVDGEIGPLTRAAIAQSPLAKTLADYAAIRRRRYRALRHFWRFGRGWLKRVDTTLARARALGTNPDLVAQPEGDQTLANKQTKGAQGKWWGQSLTIWGVLITALTSVVPAIGPAIGVDIPGDLVSDAGGQVVNTVQAVGGLIGTLMAIFGRMRADQPLQRRDLSIRL